MTKHAKLVRLHVTVGKNADIHKVVEQIHIAAKKAGPGNQVEILIPGLAEAAPKKKAATKKAPAKKAAKKKTATKKAPKKKAPAKKAAKKKTARKK